MNRQATSEMKCADPLIKEWTTVSVTVFTLCICIINQAKWKQMPLMLFISLAGYVVNMRAAAHFKGASTLSNTIGALSVGM